MNKEAIKYVIDNVGTISFTHKYNDADNMHTKRFMKYDGAYAIMENFSDIRYNFDEAYELFLDLYFNIGYFQQIVWRAHPELDLDYDRDLSSEDGQFMIKESNRLMDEFNLIKGIDFRNAEKYIEEYLNEEQDENKTVGNNERQ